MANEIIDFFNTSEIQELIKNYIKALEKTDASDDFEKKKLNLLKSFFESLTVRASDWDQKTQANIQLVGDSFKNELIAVDLSTLSTNTMFTLSFRFVMERDMFTPEDGTRFTISFKNFAIYESKDFDERNKEQIICALHEMPITIVKKFIFSDNVKSFKEFNEKMQKAEESDKNWKDFLNQKQIKVDALNTVLTRQESAFNFVGLYQGFAKLGRMKATELKWARIAMFFFGGILPIPLICEAFYLAFTSKPIADIEHLIKTIPVLSITLILIYYFRIAIGNYNSVRAQVMQIELRKSLCRFIQSYSDYAKELKSENKDLLSKFEDVIFSNVMTSEEKIPSTFDGIEHIANLIGAFKGGKGK